MLSTICLLALTIHLASGTIELQAPNGQPVASYKAALYWNTRRIVIDPPIKAVIKQSKGDHGTSSSSASLICGFQLHQRDGVASVPVEIRLSNPVQGTGHLFAKDGVDLSVYGGSTNETFFDFDISAFDCERPMDQSSRIPVMLRVTEWETPKFTHPEGYTAKISQSASVGTDVLKIEAFESHKSADICRYEIENEPMSLGGEGPVVPFDIDGNGKIRLKTPLVPTEKEQHFNLRVTAIDCNVPESRKSYVSVFIVAEPSVARQQKSTAASKDSSAKATLTAEWMNVPSKLVYPSSSGVNIFAPKAALSNPSGNGIKNCEQNSAAVKITVQSSAWDQVCERNVQSLYEQRSVCQVNAASVDLLNPHYSPAALAADSAAATVDISLPDCKCCKAADIATALLKQKLEQQQKKLKQLKEMPKPKEHHSFDGVQYYMDVPDEVVPKSHLLGDQFTLHFWLRHGPMRRDQPKEQILCSADERDHNRHHYSIFLHNCKLILLLRREFDKNVASGSLSAAEWRFRLSEVCDSDWHHYAISYSAGRVKLDIDGRIFAASPDNPQILDDTPMHRSPSSATRLTIGACWHGSSGVYRQFLKGSLAGLVLLRNSLESDTVIHCLNQCHEKLDFSTKTQLEPGMSVSLNADYTMIEIKGRNATEVARLLRSIGYINVRRGDDELSGGKVTRSIRLDTAVTCTNPKTSVTVEPVNIPIEIADAPPPTPAASAALLADRLCITGPNLIRYRTEQLAPVNGGVKFLEGLEISLSTMSTSKPSSPPLTLDACVLRTSPDFTAVESLIWPAGKATDVGVEGRIDRRQLLLEGYATPEVYENLLQQVAYSNSNPIIRYRMFVLTCSVRGGVIVSNEFSVKMSILYPSPSESSKHTVKKQLPDPTPVTMPLLSGLSRDDGLKINTDNSMDRQQHQHMAESHVVKSAGQILSRPHPDSNQIGTPIAPIAIGLASAGLLILALGLMYLRYRRSAQGGADLLRKVGSRGGGGVGGKVLPVDAESQAEMEWDNSALNITVNPLDNEENMSDSGSEDNQEDDDYVEDELNLDNGSSCSDEMEDDIDGMTASGLLMQRSAQIASSEDELDDDVAVVQMVTGPEAVRYGQLMQQKQKQQQQPLPQEPVVKQQLEWDDSSLPDVSRLPIMRSAHGAI